MSIAVLVSVHDGVVLAADSASTLVFTGMPSPAGPPIVAQKVYDHANKIFNLVKGYPLGCITYGSGGIGSSSIGTLIKDFRKKLSDKNNKLAFSIDNYQVEHVAKLLGQFVDEACSKLKPPERTNINIGFMIAGYSTVESLGESWGLQVNKGVAASPYKLRPSEEAGISWGGQGEVLQRMVLGYGTDLFNILGQVSQPPKTAVEIQQGLGPLLSARLQAPLVFAPMPIQDAIDLARFLAHSAIMFSRFLPGAQIVGGPIEVAAITKHEGFKWISRKHYYDQSLNKEPIDVTLINN